MSLLRRSRRRYVAIPLLLALLLLRAGIPAGFMPEEGHPFRIRLCSVGLPAPAGDPVRQAPHSRHGEDCPFGHAPATGPLADVVVFPPAVPTALAPQPAFESAVPGLRLPQAHRARAPPAVA
jgi:hypothetical protein